MSVVVSTITRAEVHIRYIKSVHAAMTEKVVADWHLRPCSMYLTNGRNDLIRNFLPTEHDKMLMVDSDIAFTPEDVTRVTDHLSPETPVVGGWYRGILEDGTFVPVVYSLTEDEDGKPSFYQMFEEEMSLHPSETNPLLEVGAIGTGFMGIHRSLMEEMPNHYANPCEWFAEPVMGGKMVGEDLGFCARVKLMGLPILVDRGVRVLHFKEVPI